MTNVIRLRSTHCRDDRFEQINMISSLISYLIPRLRQFVYIPHVYKFILHCSELGMVDGTMRPGLHESGGLALRYGLYSSYDEFSMSQSRLLASSSPSMCLN